MPTYWPHDVKVTKLKHWIEPLLAFATTGQLLPNNTALNGIQDMMAVGDYAQGTAANKPLYKTNQRFGRGCVDFDGADDFMVGPDGDLIMSPANSTIICTFAPDDHTTLQDVYSDPNTRVAIRIDSGNVVCRNVSGGVGAIAQRPLVGSTGLWHTVAWRRNANGVSCILDDPDNAATTASGITDALGTMILGAGTAAGARPYNGRFGALAVWDGSLTGDDLYKGFFYFLSRWGDRGDALEQAREVASRFLQLRGRPRNFVEIRSNLRALDAASAADVGVAHPRGPHPAGAGWLKTERRPTRKLYSRFSPGALTVDLKLADAYDVAHLFRDTGTAIRSSDSKREGVTLSGVGSSYEFQRIGNAWIRDPGDLRVVPILPGTIKIERTPIHWAADPTRVIGGILTENFATNHLIRSSLAVLTSLTQTPGTGGTIALDSTLPLLFDTTVTPSAAKLTSGTTDCWLGWPATISFAANSVVCFSGDYRCDTGHAMSYQLVRNLDGFFWNDSTKAWTVTNTWNALTITAALDILRGRSKAINVGASATTITTRIGFPGTTSGRIGHVYHMQDETHGLASPLAGGFPTSRIVTTTAEAGRAHDLIARPNPSTRRGWSNTEGTLLCKYTSLYHRVDLVDMAATPRHIFQVHHDVFGAASGNGWTLDYEPLAGSGELQFFGSNAGQGATPPRAKFGVALVAGQTYRIGARWIGGVVSLFVDGVKGTDATINGTPTETDDSMIYVGGFLDSTTGRNADGYLEDIEVKPRALHDETIKAWRA